MSRTKKGSKPPSWEYWGKRPFNQSGCAAGTKNKRIGIKIERARLKAGLHREMSDMNDKRCLVECPKCGWVHFAVSEEYVQKWEAEWQKLFKTKPKEWLAAYGITDAPPTRAKYLECFRCRNKDTKSFFPTAKDVSGHTIQSILWEDPSE